MSVEEGKKAPDFTAPTDGGGRLKLSELRGKPLVLYFYPKDDTPGCTTEACGFRDAIPDLKKLKAQVVGVSKDSVARHDKFKAKYDLPFPLVSDEARPIAHAPHLAPNRSVDEVEIAWRGRTFTFVGYASLEPPPGPVRIEISPRTSSAFSASRTVLFE